MHKSLLVRILIEIGYVVKGIFKVPVAVFRWILAIPFYFLANIARFGRGDSDYSDNLFGQISDKLVDFEL